MGEFIKESKLIKQAVKYMSLLNKLDEKTLKKVIPVGKYLMNLSRVRNLLGMHISMLDIASEIATVEIQKLLTALSKVKDKLVPPQGSSSKAKQKPQKKKAVKSGKPKRPNPKDEIGRREGSGGFKDMGRLPESASEKALELLSEYTVRHTKKVTDYPSFIPTIYLKMPKFFERNPVAFTNILPVVLMRSRITRYMTSDMTNLCSSILGLSKTMDFPIYYYRDLDGVFFKNILMRERIMLPKVISTNKRNIIIPTCGCTGSGVFRSKWAKDLVKAGHKVHWLTFYPPGGNCGCSTFRKINNSDSALGTVTYNIV